MAFGEDSLLTMCSGPKVLTLVHTAYPSQLPSSHRRTKTTPADPRYAPVCSGVRSRPSDKQLPETGEVILSTVLTQLQSPWPRGGEELCMPHAWASSTLLKV